jgi:hypothetical protein
MLLSFQSEGSDAGQAVDSLERLKSQTCALGIQLITEVNELSEWPEGVIGRRACNEELSVYADLLWIELSHYPQEILRKMRLRRIVLCADLTVDSSIIGGFTYEQDGTLYLEVSDVSEFAFYQRKIIHHELFHLIDAVDQYKSEESVYEDREWAALNPSDFKYVEGVDNGGRIGIWRISCNWPGFVTRYGMSSIQDDKAELFANMMTLPTWVEYLCQHDEMIRAKAVRMRQILAEFCTCADAEFWETIAERCQENSVGARGGDTMEILRNEKVER